VGGLDRAELTAMSGCDDTPAALGG
jgi:hypothetical protein